MKVLSLIVTLAALIGSAHSANDVRTHLVSVRRYRLTPVGLRTAYATGICIDDPCSVVATVHHALAMGGVGRFEFKMVGGQATRRVLTMASERDVNAVDVPSVMGMLHFDVAHDIAFVYTKKPVHKKSAISFSYGAFVGQKVYVAGFRRGRLDHAEAHIVGVNVPVLLGSAVMRETLILDLPVQPGMSGSAIVDESGNLLGMVTGSAYEKRGSGDVSKGVALPVRAIARALIQLDPALGKTVSWAMPEEAATSGQESPALYEENVPEITPEIIQATAISAADIPDAVARLQANAEAASRQMINLVVTQCLTQKNRAPICHELSIIRDGEQSFREITGGNRLGKPTDSFPVPRNDGVWVTDSWAATLSDVANEPWVFKGVVGDRYVFYIHCRRGGRALLSRGILERLGSYGGFACGSRGASQLGRVGRLLSTGLERPQFQYYIDSH